MCPNVLNETSSKYKPTTNPSYASCRQTQCSSSNENDNKKRNVVENKNDTIVEFLRRVFCNGFMGCGNKQLKRYRKLHKSLIKLSFNNPIKRPFCNTFGCRNFKRSSPANLLLSSRLTKLLKFVNTVSPFTNDVVAHRGRNQIQKPLPSKQTSFERQNKIKSPSNVNKKIIINTCSSLSITHSVLCSIFSNIKTFVDEKTVNEY